MSTTYEDATKCPKCELPGEVTSKTKKRRFHGGPFVEIHMVFCRNDKCKWYNTSWLVQVNEDGSIPEPYQQVGKKRFPNVSPETETRIQEAIQAQLNQETKPGGGEVTR